VKDRWGLIRLLATPYRLPRHAYKRVWNSLSLTHGAAKRSVAGYEDESQILESAEQSRSYLDAHLHMTPEDTVLEIGCGVGRVGVALAPVCRRWIGCDVSRNMLRYARRRLAGVTNVELIEISGYDLSPVPDESVDVVYCIVVFMHLDEWDRYNYVMEARRVLRPGGRMLFNNVNLCANEGWDVFEAHRKMPPGERPAHMTKTSTPEELRTYLTRAGIRDVAITTNHMWVTATGRK
jgi:cyclopropane fatty-acyl-phospholipid synthase-like methyltransferase